MWRLRCQKQAGGNRGSRVAFAPGGTVYMTVGERHEQTPAQDLHTHKGKILRLNDDGTSISKYTARGGMDQPIVHWAPSISPSGLTIDSGERFPAWRGNVFLGALSGLNLRRLELRDGRVAHEEVLRLQRPQRDGLLYVLTDASALLRLEPAP